MSGYATLSIPKETPEQRAYKSYFVMYPKMECKCGGEVKSINDGDKKYDGYNRTQVCQKCNTTLLLDGQKPDTLNIKL